MNNIRFNKNFDFIHRRKQGQTTSSHPTRQIRLANPTMTSSVRNSEIFFSLQSKFICLEESD